MSAMDIPPSPGVPKLPETHFDSTLSFSFDNIMGDNAIGDTDINPEYV